MHFHDIRFHFHGVAFAYLLYEYVNTLLCVLYLTVYICISIRDMYMILPHRLVGLGL